ncbi:TPA: hypothetical protein JBF73_07725 [Legionella pneumophila]|nr:hypothetical protein [Legionella pneumophila]
MKRWPARVFSTLILSLAFITVGHADLLGVEDAALLANAVKQLRELQEQYKLLQSTYQTSQAQLESIKSIKEYNSGSYGFGALENGLDSLEGWQNPANNWREALEHISGGKNERYAELVRNYEASHPMLSDAEFSKGATPSRSAQYKYSKKVNKTISVETTKMFDEINMRLKNINNLSRKIDETPNTKSAVDLNSRLTAELTYVSVMHLKLQALMSQQITQNTANELAEEGEIARFNTLR